MKKTSVIIFFLSLLVIILLTLLLISPEPSIDKNQALENIFQRKSVRSYTSDPISREQLNTLIRAGMAAPTAVNKQPWFFIAIDQRALLDSLAEGLPYAKMLKEATAAIVVCGDLIKAQDKGDSYWVQDCSAATQNILLAAESMGLGAVWTAAFPNMERNNWVRHILRIPEHLVPLNVIPIGYPAKDEQPKNKYKKENIHFNSF